MNGVTWASMVDYLLVFAVLLGLLVGSFLNVVIYRVPAGLSVVSPPSRCPKCETRIKWYDNIPVLSWLILGGKCRACEVRIPARYAMVEALVGALSGLIWWQIASPLRDVPITQEIDFAALAVVFGLKFCLMALLVVIAFVDLDHFIIPHQFTVPGMVLGLASPWILGAVFGFPDYMRIWPPVTPIMSFAGFLFGGLSVVAVFYLYLAARNVEGLGGGDVTLMAMVGAWLGPPGVIFVFFAASVQGLIVAGLTMALGIDFVADANEIFAEEDAEEAAAEEAVDEAVDSGADTAVVAEEGRAEAEGDAPTETTVDEHALAHGDPVPAEEVEVEGRDDIAVVGEEEGPGPAAVPFGPFIALAALEFLIAGPYLPDDFTLRYLYYFF